MCRVSILNENGIPVTVEVSVKSIRYLLITSVKLNVSARRILDTVTPVPGIPA